MTDEEIEKALTQCGDLSNFDCKGCPLEGEALCYSIIRENALDYINRLKEQIYQTEQKLAECENGYQATLDLERRMRADDKEQARKDTAKEILQLWYDECMARLRPEEAKQVAQIAKDYGVGVDDE